MLPEILDRGFNVATLHLAGRTNPMGWCVSQHAPGNLTQLRTWAARDGRITVWDGASEKTIYGDPEVNYAARAWHDACHLRANAEFTFEGEQRTLRQQLHDLWTVYGVSGHTIRWGRILTTEVMGQVEYTRQYGAFPSDQIAFVRGRMDMRGSGIWLQCWHYVQDALNTLPALRLS